MSGYATGSFTFSVDQFTGDAQTNHAEFKDIPTTAQTRVRIDTVSDIRTLSAMRIDSNGDGATDSVLQPALGGVVYYDTVPPEIGIGYSTTSKRIEVSVTDNLPGATSAATSSVIKGTDAYGNWVELLVSKNSTAANAATFIAPTLRYSTGTTTNATTTLRYFWTTDKTGKYTLFISAIKTPTDRVLSIYTSLTGKTYLVSTTAADDTGDLSLQSALLLLRNKTKTLNGLMVPRLLSKQGTMMVTY
jgi:hypothetical protein